MADFKSRVGKGKFVRIKGRAAYDPYDKEVNVGHIFGMKLISNFVEIRHDTAVDKRIELHCHTKMSDMDGVSDVRKLSEGLMTGDTKQLQLLTTVLFRASLMHGMNIAISRVCVKSREKNLTLK